MLGAGRSGLTLALALTRFMADVRVALVDRPRFLRAEGIFGLGALGRVKRVLRRSGSGVRWPGDAQPILEMKITIPAPADIARAAVLSFGGEVAPGEPFAHMVPNRVLIAALLEGGARPGGVFRAGGDFGLRGRPAVASLTLRDGRQLAAPLIVAADGAIGGTRHGRHRVVAHDYRQRGIVTTISHQLEHFGVAMSHFRPAGPFASLPLPGRSSSLVWTETPGSGRTPQGDPLEEVSAIVEGVMGSSLGTVTVEEPLAEFSPQNCRLPAPSSGRGWR